MVVLTTSDGEEITVDRDIIERSKLIRGLLEDTNDADAPIPLMNVKASILKKIIEYCTYHKDDPMPDENDEDLPPRPRALQDIDPWDYQFAKVDKEVLFELILAANYLDIRPLISVCCKMVANLIRGKSVEQVRQEFGIVSDFTPEEEEEIRRENAWIENR